PALYSPAGLHHCSTSKCTYALLVRGDSLLVLDLLLDILDGVGRLHIEGDGLAREGLHEDLHGCRGCGCQISALSATRAAIPTGDVMREVGDVGERYEYLWAKVGGRHFLPAQLKDWWCNMDAAGAAGGSGGPGERWGV